jgi:hypothetical protein
VSRAPLLLLLALALLLAGCGDSPKEPPRAGVGPSLDADNLAHVHDELYACLRAELPDVLLANYLGGQASITNRLARSTFDERLAVPGAERELLDAGRAEFIGVRANRSLPRWRAVPEWDLLILPTTADAQQAAAQIGAGAAQAGIFVRVVKRPGSGRRARAAEAALTRCLQLSRRD